jgi:hypothetical protein
MCKYSCTLFGGILILHLAKLNLAKTFDFFPFVVALLNRAADSRCVNFDTNHEEERIKEKKKENGD